jgi:hypothetical protein
LQVASVPVHETEKDEAMVWVVESGVDIAFLLDTDDTCTNVEPPPGSGYTTVGQVFVGRHGGITVVAKSGVNVVVEDLRDNSANPLIRAAITIGDSELAVYAVYLPPPGTNAEADQRNDVLAFMADLVAAETIPTAVIGGLGATQWSHAFGILTGEADLIDSSPGHGFQASSPGNCWIGFRVPCNHLLHTSTLTTTERHIDADLGQGMRTL